MNILGNLLQTIGATALLLGYFPQIIQLYKTKKSEDISTSFWIILTSGLACISANMIISHVPIFIVITQVANTVLALWTLILVKKYKNMKK